MVVMDVMDVMDVMVVMVVMVVGVVMVCSEPPSRSGVHLTGRFPVPLVERGAFQIHLAGSAVEAF